MKQNSLLFEGTKLRSVACLRVCMPVMHLWWVITKDGNEAQLEGIEKKIMCLNQPVFRALFGRTIRFTKRKMRCPYPYIIELVDFFFGESG